MAKAIGEKIVVIKPYKRIRPGRKKWVPVKWHKRWGKE
jgi:hypothetical protein